jgi:hypothetical protein
MLIGSLWYLVFGPHDRDAIIRVQVVNTNTGGVTEYEARRGSIETGRFVTVDGRQIRIAAIERLVIPASD